MGFFILKKQTNNKKMDESIFSEELAEYINEQDPNDILNVDKLADIIKQYISENDIKVKL